MRCGRSSDFADAAPERVVTTKTRPALVAEVFIHL
jgi:hypothetical protein